MPRHLRHSCALGFLAVAATVLGLCTPGAGGSLRARWVITDVGMLRGSSATTPVAINNRGQVVAYSAVARSSGGQIAFHGFLWQEGKLIELGSLGGGSSTPAAINERGQIVGQSQTTNGKQHAFLWQRGRMTDLGTLGGPDSRALGINERGQVVGDSSTARGELHAFLWQRGRMSDLGKPGEWSSATGISDDGQVIGTYTTVKRQQRGFVWQNGKRTDLGLLAGQLGAAFRGRGQQQIEPAVINGRGQIVGAAHDSSGSFFSAFLWQNGKLSGFGPFGGQPNAAKWINQRGQVLIQTMPPTDKRGEAFLWQNGKLTQLPNLGRPATFATALNDQAQIVGTSLVAVGHERPFVWQNGKMTPLPTLAGTDTPPWGSVVQINNRGQILGSGFTRVAGRTEEHIVLWTLRS